ncbi:MAG: condensation domain-containing protein [Gordonia sp. (in: high G+C Gram-positive bacteria)]
MTKFNEVRHELLRRRLAKAGISGPEYVTSPTLVAGTESTAAPTPPANGDLGPGEARMWKIYQFDPTSISHNIGLIFDFTETFSVARAVAAVEVLIARCTVFRSVINDDTGSARRVEITRDGVWTTPETTWEWGSFPSNTAAQQHSSTWQSAEIERDAQALGRTPFDLTTEPPLRVRIYSRADSGTSVVLVVHHIAVDATSWPALIETLITGQWPQDHAARVPAPQSSAAPDIDSALRHALNTWGAHDVRYPLSGALPHDTAEQSWLAPLDDGVGERVVRPVDSATVKALQEISPEVYATVNALLLTVCALGVYAVTGAADHVLVVPADNRHPAHSPDRVGYSGNIIPKRFQLDPAATVRQTLRESAERIYGSMEFAAIDYGTILTALRGAGGRFPVAEIMASVRDAPHRGVRIPDDVEVRCRSIFTGLANYPLNFAFEFDADDSLHLELDYQPAVVDSGRAEAAANTVIALLQHIPSSLDRPLGELIATVGPERKSVGG